MVTDGSSLPACLAHTLTALRLSSHQAVSSLAGLGCSLAAGLPSLRELRMAVVEDHGGQAQSSLSASTGRLLEALLSLAGQLQVRGFAI